MSKKEALVMTGRKVRITSTRSRYHNQIGTIKALSTRYNGTARGTPVYQIEMDNGRVITISRRNVQRIAPRKAPVAAPENSGSGMYAIYDRSRSTFIYGPASWDDCVQESTGRLNEHPKAQLDIYKHVSVAHNKITFSDT